MMCDIIQARAANLMDEFLENPSPWSFTIIDTCRLFMSVRRMVGGHSRGFDQFPWFDDNVAASLRPIMAKFRKIRYDTWAKFHWDVSLPKAAINYWEKDSPTKPPHPGETGASHTSGQRVSCARTRRRETASGEHLRARGGATANPSGRKASTSARPQPCMASVSRLRTQRLRSGWARLLDCTVPL